MAKGRPRTNPETLKKQGTYRKDRHEGRSMEALPGTNILIVPPAPDWLGARGKAEWVRLVPLLLAAKTLAQTDLGMLALACNEWECYIEASTEAREIGRYYTVMGKDGNVAFRQVHPIHSVSRDHLRNYIALCNEFGLSPAARAKVPHEKETQASKMSGLLRKAI